MNSCKVNGAEMVSVKYQIYGIDTQAKKEYSLNYRACMGTPLQRMYVHVHTIANILAVNDLIQN